LIGPPRSGKGLHLLIGAILDAPGPVVTTSSRADNYAATAAIRRSRGPVALFDPQGLTDTPTTLKWSPITRCEVPRVANQRAACLQLVPQQVWNVYCTVAVWITVQVMNWCGGVIIRLEQKKP